MGTITNTTTYSAATTNGTATSLQTLDFPLPSSGNQTYFQYAYPQESLEHSATKGVYLSLYSFLVFFLFRENSSKIEHFQPYFSG